MEADTAKLLVGGDGNARKNIIFTTAPTASTAHHAGIQRLRCIQSREKVNHCLVGAGHLILQPGFHLEDEAANSKFGKYSKGDIGVQVLAIVQLAQLTACRRWLATRSSSRRRLQDKQGSASFAASSSSFCPRRNSRAL